MRWLRLFRRHRRRLADLDARVADAAGRASAAAAEAEKSAQRLESVQQHVVRPLREAAAQNQFADLIRQALTENNVHREEGAR